jgi:hypothetical protein
VGAVATSGPGIRRRGESVEREVRKWVKQIEKVLGERLDDMLT